MTVALPTILQPGAINQTISQLNVINDRLQNFFIGGGGTETRSGRYFSWDIYNDSRAVGEGRAPGTPPNRIAPNPVGNVTGEFPRWHESIPLLYEKIHNMRQVGSLNPDIAGESYITRQEAYLAQRAVNHREFQFLGMTRGKYWYTRTGDRLIPSLTSGSLSIDFQVPAGNKDQLDALGTGDIISVTWNTASTDIPLHVSNIDKASEVLTGRPIRHAWCNATRMNYILNNDKIRSLAGSVNRPWDRYERMGDNDFVYVLTAIPWLTWHVTNGVVDLDGTTTALFSDDLVLFTPQPDSSWVQYMQGSEVVVEYPGATPTERFGAYFWAEPTTKPAGYELAGVMNGIPALYNPSCLFIADVTP